LKDYKKSSFIFNEALSICHKNDREAESAPILNNLGIIFFHEREFLLSKKYFLESLKSSLRHDIRTNNYENLMFIVQILVNLNQSYPLASSLLGQVQTMLSSGNSSLAIEEQTKYNDLARTLRGYLGDNTFETAYNQGIQWSLAETLRELEEETK
jgi:hypothetical protein